MFEGLEGEDGGADFAGFAIPDELDFAFVGEEDEAIFFGEGLALLDEFDEVALVGIGEIVGTAPAGVGRFGGWRRGGSLR